MRSRSTSPPRRTMWCSSWGGTTTTMAILLLLITMSQALRTSQVNGSVMDVGIFPPGRISRAEVMREVLAILQEEEEMMVQRQAKSSSSVTRRRMQPAGYSLNQDKGPLPMDGVTLRVGVVIEPPLVTRQNGSNTTGPGVKTNDLYGGLIIDLLRSHSMKLGFDYEIMEPSDGFFGVKQPNGTYNGLMGLYQREDVDVLYSGLHVNSERAKLIDFTQSYLPSGYMILTKPLEKAPNIWFILSPFSTSLWLCILAMVIFMALVFSFLDRASPYGKRVHSQPNWFWHSCGVLLNIGEFLSVNHRGLASSILTLIWTFGTLTIVTLYTANMVSSLTVSRLEAPVQSVNDIISKQLKVATIASSASRAWTLNKWPALIPLEVPQKTFDEAVKSLRAGRVQAVIFVTAVVQAVANHPPCDLVTVGETFGATFISVAIRPGAQHFDYINDLIFDQISSGYIESLTTAYIKDECKHHDPSTDTSTITVTEVKGLFYIIFIGIAIAFLCLAVQIVQFRVVLLQFGKILHRNNVNEDQFMDMVATYSRNSRQGLDDSLVLSRAVKTVLLKLGLDHYEIGVIISACDANVDGFLDPLELESLKLMARRALSTHKVKASPYSMNPRLWRLGSLTVIPPRDLAEAGDDDDGLPSAVHTTERAHAYPKEESKWGRTGRDP